MCLLIKSVFSHGFTVNIFFETFIKLFMPCIGAYYEAFYVCIIIRVMT